MGACRVCASRGYRHETGRGWLSWRGPQGSTEAGGTSVAEATGIAASEFTAPAAEIPLRHCSAFR